MDSLTSAINPTIKPKKHLKKQKLTPVDKVILKNYNPELSTYCNLQQLENKGKTSLSYAYQRFKKNQYLSEKIDTIHAHWEERIARELMPKAVSNLTARLKGKRVVLDEYGKSKKGDNGKPLIEVIDTFPADKLVIDTYYKRNDQPQVQVNTYIDEITQMFGGFGQQAKTRPASGIIDLRPDEPGR